MIPNWFHDWNVRSQSMVKVVPVDWTKFSAKSRLSWVPTPMTVSLSAFCRANCSTPGASRRQTGQWGAQNHSTMGRSDGAKPARFTVAPESTFTNSTDGRSDSGIGVGSGAGGGVGSGVGRGAEAGVDSGVDAGVDWAVGTEVAADSGVAVVAVSGVAAASVDLGVGVSSGSGSPGEAPMLFAWEVGSAGAATSVESGSDDGCSGAGVLVGAAVGSDSIGRSSVTEVSDPPQAAASSVRASAMAEAATTPDRQPERHARMLTP